MRKFVLVLSLAMFSVLSAARPAQAILQFQKEFINLYVGDEKDSDFGKIVKQAGCFVCHQGKLRKNHNPYGIHLVDLLDKKADMKNPEKIIEALKKVEAMHSVAGDDNSPTYGQLIKKGELPGGSIEDAKKEPAEKEAATE
jgi:hypothetical protein